MDGNLHLNPQYIAWIPCISGELFFSKIKHGLGAYDLYLRREQLREKDSNKFLGRKIIATSVVDWQDSNLFAEPFKGLYRVIVVASAKNYHSLEGTIYFIEKNNLDTDSLRRKFRPRVNDNNEAKFINKMGEISSDEEINSSDTYEVDYDKIVRLIDCVYTSVAHNVQFSINANGIVSLQWNSTKILGVSEEIPEKSQRTLCRQGFYYLKYLLHKHTHHSHANESLTTVHRLKDCNCQNSYSLVRDLKRGLVDIKRMNRFTHHSVSGICEYGKSLVTSCNGFNFHNAMDRTRTACEKRPTSGESFSCETQIRYFDGISNSLNLASHPKGSNEGAIRTYLGNFRKTLLLSLAIISPIFIYLIRQAKDKEVHQSLLKNVELNCITNTGSYIDELRCKLYSMLSGLIEGSLPAAFGTLGVVVFIAAFVAIFITPWKRYPLIENSFLWLRNRLIGRKVLNWTIFKFGTLLSMWARRGYLTIYPSENKFFVLILFACVIPLVIILGKELFLNILLIINSFIN